MPLFSFDDKRVKKIIKDAVDAKEGDFNGQKMLMGTTVNPVVVVNPYGSYKQIYYDVTAVQNTWYQVASLDNVKVSFVAVSMATLAEDIQVRIVADDLDDDKAQAGAVAGTFYYFFTTAGLVDAIEVSTTQYMLGCRYNALECRHFEMYIRKTSANGANVLSGMLHYNQS